MPRVSPSVYFAGFDDHSHVRDRSGPKRQIEILGLVLFFFNYYYFYFILLLYSFFQFSGPSLFKFTEPISLFSQLGFPSINKPEPAFTCSAKRRRIAENPNCIRRQFSRVSLLLLLLLLLPNLQNKFFLSFRLCRSLH